MAGIIGKSGAGGLVEEAARVTASRINTFYESKEFALAGVQVDYNVATGQTAFVGVPQAHTIVLRTDQDITFKLNATTNAAITLKATEGTFGLDSIEVTNIFITTTVAGANIKLLLA